MDNSTISPEIHIRSGSISSVYHKHPFCHSIIEMNSRKIGTESATSIASEYTSRTEQTTPGDLEDSRPNLNHEEDKKEQAVGLVPSLNK